MSEVANEGMTFDQAADSLREAGAQEAADSSAASPELGQFATSAEQEAATPTPGEEVAPEGEQTPFTSSDVPEDSFTGPDFNPDLLPPELQDGWKSLQGDYTRKTQALAEERKALEELGSVEELQQAREFYQSLQDPEYLQAFHSELTGVLQELGLSPQEAAAVAEEAVIPESPALSPELAQVAQTDPELAPFVEQFASMQQRLDSFEKQQAEREQAMVEERQLMDQAAEIDRMVQAVREQNPNYGDDDFEAIYDRAVAFDGDVLRAAELYAADRDRIIREWTEAKPVPHAVQPTTGGGVVTEDEPEVPQTLDDAQRAAEAYLQAEGLSEFGG